MHAFLQTNPHDTSPWLSPDEIALVRAQFACLQQDADAFAMRFYTAFFSRMPIVRPMFRGQLEQHGEKFMQMLTMLVDQLHASESIAEQLAQLGLRHRGYGVLALDYDHMGKALTTALASHLGTAFDTSARTAWEKAYVFIASSMQSARA